MSAMKSLLSISVASQLAVSALSDTDVLPNNCKGLQDGTYLMKLIDSDDYPIVSIKCSNEYGILDYSHDPNIQYYFDTWSQWFPATAGPENLIHPNWEEWFLPTKEDLSTNFVLSPDCNTCESSHSRQLYNEKSTYWMTGTVFGCFWKIKGSHNCDVSYDSNECYTCTSLSGSNFKLVNDDTSIDEYKLTGICPHSVWPSNQYTPQTHDACTESETDTDDEKQHLKPSIGMQGEYCVCFQQSITEYYQVDTNEIDIIANDVNADTTTTTTVKSGLFDTRTRDESNDVIIEIYQSDFKDGTYRITNPGSYKIMEDITFDFHANIESPNAKYSYKPYDLQNENGIYPGAGQYRNPYFLGFFAGITIETNDVILDLNGHTLKMSDYFYHQQRWFTIIELTTQYFLPGQGIGNFGGSPSIATNIVILNGILGLTSHHGIHGNYNKHITIKDIKVKEFETHGIQFNGFEDIHLMNVEVGPTSDKVLFSGEYGHARYLLPRYYKIADEMDLALANGEITEDDMKISFYGREHDTTMREIADELELQMNLAFNYAVNGKTIEKKENLNNNDNDDNSYNTKLYDSFISAKKLFINENNNNLPSGGAQYGIFLNTFGASVFTYNLNTNFYSSKAYLTNVKVHGMRHHMKEYVRLNEYGTANIIINPFNAPLNVEEMFESVDNDGLKNPKYRGNIILDAVLASNKFSDSFDYLGLQIIKNNFLVDWATSDDFTSIVSSETGYAQIGCNSDVMIHSGKGINGIRLDGVEKVHMTNVEVYDLIDSTPVGKDTCGEYSTKCASCDKYGGHFRQTEPMQIGFSGNMNQAININAAKDVIINGVNIHDIESKTGPAFGISLWPSCDLTLKGKVKVSNLIAGSDITQGTYQYDDLPNKAPEVCAIRAYYEYDDYETILNDELAVYNIDSDSLSGHVGCLGSSIVDLVDQDTFDQLNSNSEIIDVMLKKGEFLNNNNKNDDDNNNNKKKGKILTKWFKFSELDNIEWLGLNLDYLFLMLVFISVICLVFGSYYLYHSFGYIKARLLDGYTIIKNNNLIENENKYITNDPNLFVF